jgi:hypothetical protein
MKAILLTVIFLASTMNVAQEQQKPANEACGFTVSQDSTAPSITGPDDLTPLVYVVDQPDSPIQIVSVDLKGMWLSVSNNRYTAHHCAKYQVRNRSNQVVRSAEIMLGINGRGGFGAIDSQPISSGQTVELNACNGGGTGSMPGSSVKLVVFVQSIGFADCMYRPSVRIPRNLGVQPVWGN